MKKIQIKSIFGKIIFEYEKEKNTIKDTLIEAINKDADLRYANLQDADLRYADLRDADLQGANLRYANLQDADLRDADLRYANLQDANLQDADLRYANLQDADLRYANLRYANLRDADLRDADLRYANLQDADLRYADLRYANLQDADLRYANLRGIKNKEKAILPIFCKWRFGILGNKIKIGCKTKSIEEWDVFFSSDLVYSTNRDTEEFKQIEAVYNALKSYLLTIKK